jgi:hypothetical protein
MSDPTRARGHEWQFVDEMFCLTVHGADRETSVAIPIGALLTLAADGRRRQMALHRKTMAAENPSGSKQLSHDTVLPVQTWSVGTSDAGAVVLILDRGLDTEVLLGLTPDVAETLADLLIKNAQAAGEAG